MSENSGNGENCKMSVLQQMGIVIIVVATVIIIALIAQEVGPI